MPNTADGLREAWTIVERTWRSTFSHARQLPESLLHENVNGEWSFVETQRHLLFATDVWVRRSILDEPAAWHRLGMPPDLRTGQPDRVVSSLNGASTSGRPRRWTKSWAFAMSTWISCGMS